MSQIEIRLRTSQIDVPWNEAPIADVLDERGYFFQHMNEYLRFVQEVLLDTNEMLLELRWNYQGSLQGHYLQPPNRPSDEKVFQTTLTFYFSLPEYENLHQQAVQQGFHDLQELIDTAARRKQQDMYEYIWGY
ncbi:MAG: hypothetical protein KF770_28575 [Anaerolineae bacterium]|nr:hypothetical protein [Anaerolineae bacterium]